MDKNLANNEIKNIIQAIGPGIEPKFDYEKLQYGKIILMTDADVDGAHICTLLLTFFYRFMPQLVLKGHLFIAQPPLYRIDSGKNSYYAVDDLEKDRIIGKLNGNKHEVGRFKGLGEMPASDLKMTTMDKEKRTLIKVTVANEKKTDNTFDRLMGTDAQQRIKFINERAVFFQDLEI